MSDDISNQPLSTFIKPGGYDNSAEPIPWSNKPQTLMGLIITFLLLSWASVCFRLYVRLRIVRSPWWDDLFVALYLLCGTVGSVTLLLSIQFGAGKHLLTLTVWQAGRYLVAFYVFNATLNAATTFIKLSLLFQYLRIFADGSLPRRLSKGLIYFTSLWGFAYTLLAFVPCYPVWDYWYAPPGAKCWAYGAYGDGSTNSYLATFYSHTALNMLLDMTILAIPMHLYARKDMTFKMRMGLLALLFMGVLVNFFSIWRLQTIVEHQAGRYPVDDPTWYGPISLILASLEVNCASICASVPIFWPVLSPYFGTIFITHEVSVEHEYRDTYGDEEAKVQSSSSGRLNTGGANGSETELTATDKVMPPVSRNRKYNDFYVTGQLDPSEARGDDAPGTHTRARSDRARNQKRPWFRI